MIARMPRRYEWKTFLGSDAPSIVVHHGTRTGDCSTHDHDFFEIVLIAGGTARHRSVYGEAHLDAGDVFVLPPNVWHEYSACQAMEYYDCYIRPELLKQELLWVREDPALHALFWSTPQISDRRGLVAFRLNSAEAKSCRSQMEGLLSVSSSDRHSRRGAQIGQLLLLLDLLAQHVALPQRSKPQSRQVHVAVWQGIELLQTQLTHAWTLTELAGKIHIAPAYFVRLFKSTTGLPPLAYLARCRAERAATLLLRTDLPIGEIGAQVGWGEPSYFARRFKSHFGVPPIDYRRKYVRTSDAI